MGFWFLYRFLYCSAVGETVVCKKCQKKPKTNIYDQAAEGEGMDGSFTFVFVLNS